MRHIKVFVFLSFTILWLSGCLKKSDSVIDPYDLSASVYTLEWIPQGGGGTTVNSGLQYFAQGALTYPASHTSDTASFGVRLTGGSSVDRDITVTVGQDTKALLDNFKTDSITYESMPDSVYKFVSTTGVIKKGTSVAQFKVVFFPSKFNPTKNYMLAVTVITPTDHQTSTNQGHIYFHTIGNPLAGAYVTTGKRYNYSGAVAWAGPPAPYPGGSTDGTVAASYNTTVVAAPVNTMTVKLIMGNVPDAAPAGGSAYYYITGTDAKFTNITYNMGANFAAGYSNIQTYVVNYVAPTATQKASFRLITKYNNTTGGAGADRIIDQTFTQQ